MLSGRTTLLVIIILALSGAPVMSAETTSTTEPCSQGTLMDSSGICADPGKDLLLPAPEPSTLLQPSHERGRKAVVRPPQQAAASSAGRSDQSGKPFSLYLFWGKGCPHCEEELQFLRAANIEHPAMVIKEYEVWYNKQNAVLLADMLKAHAMQVSGVPITFIDGKGFAGFTRQSRQAIEAVIRKCSSGRCIDQGGRVAGGETSTTTPSAPEAATVPVQHDQGTSVDIPLIGRLDAQDTSLPIMTIVIAGLDSFNPCAFFVLLTLLGLLVHAQSRNKMILIGCVFVFFSGFIYFLFMAAWLNLFLVMGQVAVITTIAGAISVLIALINIKDYFIFKQGVSLSIPDSAKPGLFARMRRLLKTTSLFSILIGTTVLAIVANSYELLCTAGFPMVFTRILTLHHLPTTTYYLYLVLYNIVYVIPLLLIVLGFAITLGSRKLSKRQGRVLKLVSGTMMLGLGGVLILNPALLNSVMVSFAILAGALAVSLVVALATRKLGA